MSSVVMVAERVERAVHLVTGGALPVRLRGWDGSEAGPDGGPVVVLRGRGAVRRLLYSPGELGLAEAYIAGELDVPGDLYEGLAALRAAGRGLRPHVGAAGRFALAVDAIRLGAIGTRPARPGTPVRVAGRRHSPARDRSVIAQHYDLPPEFYELLLDESMAYSCGYFSAAAETGLGEAQRAKLDLICRKLGLTAGSRLLDIGCGWGSLACHAAQHYGALVTAVTLSRRQHGYVTDRVQRDCLGAAVTVLLADYRDLTADASFDAVAAIEMGEHVGDAEYPGFARLLHDCLRPGGRVLVQQMSRAGDQPDGGPFIRTWIAPDMHMKPLAVTIGALSGAGLEIRDDVQALREHYARTIAAWSQNLEASWEPVVSLLGPQVARVWRLYLAGSRLAFAEGRMGVDQILAVRPGAGGLSGMPWARAV